MNEKKKQVEKTKTKILNATFVFLADSTFEELTLNEILYESGVSKRTFYRYFNNKQDILDKYFDDFIAGYYLLKDEILTKKSLVQIVTITLNYFLENRERLRLLIYNNKFHLLLEKFNQAAIDIHLAIDAVWHIQRGDSDTELEDVLHFVIGGYFNTISHWLVEEQPRQPQEVAQNIAQALVKIGKNFMV